MSLLMVAFWICIIGFAAYILMEAAKVIPMPAPFPTVVHGFIIIVALVAAFKLLLPFIPF